jgi:hypothetical protein
VARRGLLLLLVWVAFLGDLLVGAGLLLSPRESLRTAGLVMLLAAVAAMSALTLWFYVQNKRRPTGPSTEPTELTENR